MAFRRKRRRATVNWLPPIGEEDRSVVAFAHDGVATGAFDTDLITSLHYVTRDLPAETLAGLNPQSLSDYEQSGYRLQRVVGKFCVGSARYEDQQTPQVACVAVAMGLIILKVSTTNGLALLAAANPGNYSPLRTSNQRDPWIWRRTWFLSNDLGQDWNAPDNSGWATFPLNNADFGSVMDGPHVDTTVRRRVGPEERLVMVVSSAPIFPTTSGSWHLRFAYDLRLLATPLRMTNRRNASR